MGHIPELVADSPPHEQLPQLKDITDSTGIKFDHLSSPGQKYIVESMSGGVALIDYDCDGWPDIYFTNAESVDTALAAFSAGIAAGASREAAAHLANIAAGVVVGKRGTAIVTKDEILEHLEEYPSQEQWPQDAPQTHRSLPGR